MRFFIDASTLNRNTNGTAKYTSHLYTSLSELPGKHKLTAAVNTKTARLPETDRLVQCHNSPHVTINRDLMGNAPRIDTDAAFFPNYFMPFNWEIPSAVTIHDVSFLTHPRFYSFKMRNWYRHRIKHSVKKARIILTVSRASAQQIHKHLGVSTDRIVVHLPRWLNKSPVIPSHKRERTLVYLGNMEPKKNVLRLIRAFQLSNLSEYRLMLIGSLHAGKRWSSAFRDLVQQTPGVTWKGYLPDEQVSSILKSASGFINLSNVEGFGLPQLEALAAGTPALISTDPALQEVSGGRSLTTNTSDDHEIAENIENLTRSHFETASVHADEIQQLYSRERYDASLNEIIERLHSSERPIFPGYGSSQPDESLAIISTSSYAAVFGAPISLSKMQLAFPVAAGDQITIKSEAEQLARYYPSVFSLDRHLFRNTLHDTHLNEKSGIEHSKVRKQHQKLIRLLGSFPVIKAVYFSGGTSHQTGLYTNPDLDLFIVAKKDRVWIAYLIVRILSTLLKKKDSCCSNYLVDDSAQEITWQQDYYTAFQLLFLKQVFRKKGTEHIRYHNPWIRDYFPNIPVHNVKMQKQEDRDHPKDINRSWFKPFFWLNLTIMYFFARKWQKNGNRNLKGGLMWDAFRIKLHNNDHRPYVYKTYEEILKKTRKQLTHRAKWKEKSVSEFD